MYDRSGVFRSVAYLDPTDLHFGRFGEFISGAFGRYRFSGTFTLTWMPTAIATINAIPVGLVATEDPRNPNIISPSLSTLLAMGSVQGPAWQDFSYDLELNDSGELYYIFANGESRLNFQGAFSCFNAAGSVSLGGVIGYLYASYTLDLYDPHTPYSTGPSLHSLIKEHMKTDRTEEPLVPIPVASDTKSVPEGTAFVVQDANTGQTVQYLMNPPQSFDDSKIEAGYEALLHPSQYHRVSQTGVVSSLITPPPSSSGTPRERR